MALNGYLVNTDITITWDGVSQRIMRGTVIDTPASSGSNLAATIGSSNLTALTAQQDADAGGEAIGPFMENLTGGGNMPYRYQN